MREGGKVREMNMFPGEAWKAAREVTARNSCHHNKPMNIKMRMKNGELAANDKQNIEVFEEHLTKVYNNKRECLADAAKFIRQRDDYTELDAHITMKEFTRAISKLKNNKAPGVTGVPAEAFKCLDGENLKQVYFFCS